MVKIKKRGGKYVVKGRKKPFSQAKAKKILSEKSPTLHDRPISPKQRRLLGFIAGGGTPTKI